MAAIFKREFRSFFTTITGWIFMAAFLFLFDLYFFVYNLNYGYAYISYSLSSVNFIFLIIIPILTMRILSEEKKTKTDQLIYTAPISIGKVVVSKFLAMTAVFSIVMGFVCLTPLFLRIFGTVAMGESYAAILGTWLFGLLAIAIGLFVSSLTESQVIAAILSFAFLFLGYMMDSITSLISSTGNILTKVLGCLSIGAPLDNFLQGMIDIKGIIYYISATALFLFLSCQVIQKFRWSQSSKKIKTGVFSTGLVVVGIAICVAVNLVANELPEKVSSIDVTYNDMHSITSDTKKFLKTVDSDVTIYVLVAESSKDKTLDQTLKLYEEASSKISVKYVDPVVSPNFYSTYTDSAPTSNSVIVVCDKRSKVIDYNNIYESSVDYTTYSSTTTGYDGEGQLTSAIGYVINDNLPTVYVLEGHGEQTLETSFTDALEKKNINVETVNLLNKDSISTDDVAGIIVNGPTSDLSSDDAKKLSDYLAAGGKLLVTTNYGAESELKNLDSVLAAFDIQINSGVVMEGDSMKYSQYPFYLLPEVQSTDYTSGINSYVFVPNAQGITNLKKNEDTLTWTDLLLTSESAYLKTDIANMTTYEKEDGDASGQYALGVNVTNSSTNGAVSVVSSYLTFTDSVDEAVSGSNLQLFTNLVGDFQSEDATESVSVPVKSYTLTTLTINQAVSVACGVILVIVLPIVLIVAGVYIWMRRRKK